ncbi:unnamed protein product [Parnassius apollo]|uniref:(apollo) hypothetical protein n=1 Tax=Parnassius apollo TaxID=110799 RepID=A0A8S3X5P1_PARAO|nr:unnamed protein product [Parnassius apollo]
MATRKDLMISKTKQEQLKNKFTDIETSFSANILYCNEEFLPLSIISDDSHIGIQEDPFDPDDSKDTDYVPEEDINSTKSDETISIANNVNLLPKKNLVLSNIVNLKINIINDKDIEHYLAQLEDGCLSEDGVEAEDSEDDDPPNPHYTRDELLSLYDNNGD